MESFPSLSHYRDIYSRKRWQMICLYSADKGVLVAFHVSGSTVSKTSLIIPSGTECPQISALCNSSKSSQWSLAAFSRALPELLFLSMKFKIKPHTNYILLFCGDALLAWGKLLSYLPLVSIYLSLNKVNDTSFMGRWENN